MAENKAVLNLEKYKPSTEVIELSRQLEAVVGHNPITHAFKIANMIAVVQQWVEHPEISKLVMQMENSPAGFMTDKDPGVFYPPKTRNQCVTDALVNGIRLNGNEFNIIAGKMMIVQAGWRRLCEEMGCDVPGGFSKDSNYQTLNINVYDDGEPKIQNNIATIHMVLDAELFNKATRKNEVVKFEKDISLTIKSRDTVDAWIGKAERRIYRAFFRKYSGKSIPETDTADEFDGPIQTAPPPLGDTQPSNGKKKSKVVVKKPAGEPHERPVAARVDVEDGDYKETTPAMDSAAASLLKEPEAPPPPPEQESEGYPPEPEVPEEEPQQELPLQPPTTNRPRTNF